MFKYVCVVCGGGIAIEDLQETCGEACFNLYLEDPDKYCRYEAPESTNYKWGMFTRRGRAAGWIRRDMWEKKHGRDLATNKSVWVTCGNIECVNERHFILKERDDMMTLRRRVEVKRERAERARCARKY